MLNATGPFSDAFRGGERILRPTLGVHIVVDAARLPTSGRAFVLRSPRDGRVMFVLPAGPRTIIGTTDTDWPDRRGAGPAPGDEIRAHADDVAYLLESAEPRLPLGRPAARGRAAAPSPGCAPCWPAAPPIPRPPRASTPSGSTRRGVLTVAGGKLTTMRRMGEEAVDRLVDLLRSRGVDRPLRPCQTRHAAAARGSRLDRP